MGYVIRIAMKFEECPSVRDLRELQYDLMHRFGPDRFYLEGEGGDKQHFAKIVDRDSRETWVSIGMRGSFYGEGYERGSGSDIAAVLLFLIRKYPMAEVWYGPDLCEPDDNGRRRYDEPKALELLCHYLDVGRLPYLRAFSDLHNETEGVQSPECPFCGIPMLRTGNGTRSAQFCCAGCNEELILEGKGYFTWVREGQKLERWKKTEVGDDSMLSSTT